MSLRLAANEISFLKIIEAIERPIETGDRTNGNDLQPICRSAIVILNDARTAVELVYGKLTLKDLIASRN